MAHHGEQRRRAQNRASQRAYRERKDQRIKDLEQLLNEARQRNDELEEAYAALYDEHEALKAAQPTENDYSSDLAYNPPMSMAPTSDSLDMDMFVYGHMQPDYTL